MYIYGQNFFIFFKKLGVPPRLDRIYKLTVQHKLQCAWRGDQHTGGYGVGGETRS